MRARSLFSRLKSHWVEAPGTALLAGVAGVVAMSGAQAATIEEVVRLTLASNPQIGIVASNREQIDEELRQARGLYLPQVDVAYGIGEEWTNNNTTRTAGTGTVSLLRQDLSATIKQRVFDGFETDSRVAREKSRAVSAARRVYENSEFLALDAIGAYLEVVRQRELLTLSQDLVGVHERILGQIQQRVRGGAGSNADVTQTQARLTRARATVAQTTNDLRDGEALYARIVGQYPDELKRPAVPAAALPANLDAALEATRGGNPTTKIFEADVDAAEAEVRIAEAPFYPQVNVEAETLHTNHANGVDAWAWDARVMLRLRLNLFRGGIDRANRQEALAVVAEQKNRRYSALLSANEETRRSHAALLASGERKRNLAESVQFNLATRDAYQQQFTVAQRTLLDVLDAENEVFVARGQLVSAEFNEMRASYRLIAVTGTLLKTLGVQAPAQANEQNETFADTMTK